MKEAFEDENTVQAWDAAYYHPIARKLYDRAVADMLAIVRPDPARPLLDAGCGPGGHSIRAARLGYDVTAVDFSTTMLEQARTRAAAAGVGQRITFEGQDLTQLTFADSTFHFAFSWGVVIHIPQLERALSELGRVVAPQGHLALYLTNVTAVDYWLEAAARNCLGCPRVWDRGVLGLGTWTNVGGHRLWLWRVDVAALISHMSRLGFTRVHRHIGEFTELQTRTRGPLRHALLHLNNLAYRIDAPPGLGVTNLLIFKKG